jgi:RND family efflux transporter MFP subunit
VEIGSPVRGRIQSLLVERGDAVSKGQVVAELDAAIERAAVEAARLRAQMEGDIRARTASARLGQRKQARAKKLYASNAMSLDVREETETEADLARYELQRAHESQQLAQSELDKAIAALEQRTIRSPLDGVVVERRMAAGEVVDEQTILRIAQIDPLRVEVVLPAAMFGQIQPGMRAALTPEQSGDQVHVAEVKIVDRVIDAASGTFEVRLDLPNPGGAIPGGLNCQVRFLEP